MNDEHDVRPEADSGEAESSTVKSGGFSYADPRAWLPIALLLLLAVGLGLYVQTLHGTIESLQRQLDAAPQETNAPSPTVADPDEAAEAVTRTMAIVTAPTMTHLDLAGQSTAPSARARVFWSREQGLLFTSTSLPKLPPGKVYQVWVLSARDAPFSAGLLVPNDAGAATVIYPTPADIPPPTGVAVSLEQEEAAAPTASAIILIGDLR